MGQRPDLVEYAGETAAVSWSHTATWNIPVQASTTDSEVPSAAKGKTNCHLLTSVFCRYYTGHFIMLAAFP